MTTNRWKNTIKNAEADNKANIATDRYPVIIEIIMKLKAKNRIAKPRKNTGSKRKKKIRNPTKDLAG